MENTPNGLERFCLCLKKDSLRIYVKHRLNAMTALETVNKMLTSMRETDLFDNKNIYKARELIGKMTIGDSTS